MVVEGMKGFKRQERLLTKTRPMEATKIQWSDIAPQILAVHNNQNEHSITGMTPTEAKKPGSEADAKIVMERVARRGRRFPIVRLSDKIEAFKQKKAVGDQTKNG